jgi:Tol biopolymer transport system component
MSRLTFDPGEDTFPVWAPDGSRIAFQGMNRQPPGALRQKIVAGTVDDEALLPDPTTLRPTDWSADGRFLVYQRPGASTGSDLWILPMSGERKPFAFAQSQFDERNAVFAPNGRWIAYTSNEAGQDEVYVRPFPQAGGKFQISKSGGTRPTWRADGKELFFLALDGTMMTATINTSPQFEAGTPKRLFTSVPLQFDGRQYAVSRDGKRFLVNTLQQQPTTTPLTVVVNWLSAVQK